MISVTFTESGNKLSLRVEGHAGYAEAGQDIVCAAASILAYTLASIIEKCDINATINLEIGDMTIESDYNDPLMKDIIEDSFNFALAGYALLEHNYPQYVRFDTLT
jgi:uncharacterized protein YsxB (DUF464 family)